MKKCVSSSGNYFRGIASLVMLGVWGVHAMTPLEDTEMSVVTGQDGLVVHLEGGATANTVEWEMDEGTANQASLVMRGLELAIAGGATIEVDVGSDGTDTFLMFKGSWSDLSLSIDSLGHSNQDSSIGTLGIISSGSLTMANVGGLYNLNAPGLSKGIFDLSTVGDIFIRQSTGDGAPELSFGDMQLGFRFTDGAGNPGVGRFGIDGRSLVARGDHMDFDLNFDLFYAPHTTSYFDKASRLPIMLFGWQGGIENAEIIIGSGGIGYGAYTDALIDPLRPALQYMNYGGQYATASDGLHLMTKWDYSPDFRWSLGQAAGDRIRVDFFDWQRLGKGTAGAAPHDFRMPIYLDAINAGQGAGGICFGGSLPGAGSLSAASCATVGGQFLNVAAKNNNLAVLIRDGGVHSYNTQVRLNDVDGLGNPVIDRFNWSLLYTYGKLDANLYLYPSGAKDSAPGSEKYAGLLRSDVLLTVQSPGYWQAAQVNFNGYTPANNPANRWARNTHFMIADTDIHGVATGPNPTPTQLSNRVAFGIGILNADLIWQVDGFEISLVGTTRPPANNDPSRSDYYRIVTDYPGLQAPGLRLSTSNLAKYQFRGLFGGGNLDDLSTPARIALLDVNIETDEFVFVLGPPRNPGEQYVAFDAVLKFNSNAYLTMAEPSYPSAYFGLGNVTGSIAWHKGKVELESSVSTGDRPRLTIANDLLIGGTAFGGSALRADVNFGAGPQGRLGQLVIPTGQISSSISLTPQL